ncbi:MAG: hypothetical protein C0467_03975 [Planctomycetaceae bacterium]|nr:hypothetical protein [Planctomycetaceae bacterium]
MPDFDDNSPRLSVEELKRIARYQRWVIACVLAQITMWLGILILSILDGVWIDSELPLFLTVLLGLAGGVYAFLIYWEIRNPLWAAVMGLASILPLMGLLTLTAVNGLATQILNRNGVTVGFFGADVNTIEEQSGGFYDDEDAGW